MSPAPWREFRLNCAARCAPSRYCSLPLRSTLTVLARVKKWPLSIHVGDSLVTCRRFSKKGGHGKQLGAMNNQLKYRTMTQKRVNKETKEIKAMMAGDADFLRPLVRSVIQEFLEAEMAACIGAGRASESKGG